MKIQVLVLSKLLNPCFHITLCDHDKEFLVVYKDEIFILIVLEITEFSN